MNRRTRLGLTCVAAMALLLGMVSPTNAQGLPGFGQDLSNPFGNQPAFGGGDDLAAKVTYTATLEGTEGTNTGTLRVQAEVISGWHTFSTSSPNGGPIKTELKLESADLQVKGSWLSDVDPEIHFDDLFGVDVEEHRGTVTWSVAVSWNAGFDPATAPLGNVHVTGQVCTDDAGACIPTDETPAITFTSWKAAPVLTREYRPDGSHLVLTGKVTPATAAPGDTVTLELRAAPTDDFHIYGWAEQSTPKGISAETLIVVTKANQWSVERPVADPEPQAEESGIQEQPITYSHRAPVTWSLPITIPDDAEPGAYTLEGLIGFQTCSDNSCDMPAAAKFTLTLNVAAAATSDSGEVAFTAYEPDGKDAYQAVNELAKNAAWGTGPVVKQAAPLGVILYWVGISFVAGLILNVMPCVLPVIGLKIMSLVSQAGSHRMQIVLLNLWLSIGIISVFMVLGVAAVVFGMAWSDHFTNPWFVVALTGIVFAFGLSFLGVWEVPIPGFAGSHEASQLASREGAIGAFFKGVFSTILATPCAGPMMIPALAFAITQPPVIAMGMFAAMGIGMASPYLLIGIFPSLIRLLPKPGNWMVTFKEVVGFAMLGAAVFLASVLVDDMRIPMLATAVAIGIGCWWAGKIELTASTSQRMQGWVVAVAIVAFGGWGSFKLLGPVDTELDWTPYDASVLQAKLNDGQPVFVDFTANWCFTCKVNERSALNVAETKSLFEEHKIVAMKADKTLPNAEIDQLLLELGNNAKAIPCYAVYVPGREEPVFFEGLISIETVRARLAEAGIALDGVPAVVQEGGNQPVGMIAAE